MPVSFPLFGRQRGLAALLITLAMALSACAPRTAATTPATTQVEPPPVSVTAEAVRRGQLQQVISESGEIRAPAQISVFPKASGRIRELLADVGGQVKAGDVLARLDQDNASVQLHQAEAALAAAEAKLRQVQAGGRAEDVDIAQAALEAQRAKLELMESGGRAESVAQAEAALDAAKAGLALVKKGANSDVVQAARSAVESDKAALASAESALASLTGANAADLQAAQSAYDAALAQQRAAKAALDQANVPTEAQVAEAEAAVAAAQANLESARSTRVALTEGTVPTTAGPCYKDDDGNRLDSDACNAALDAANASVKAYEAALASADAKLDQLKRGGGPASLEQLKSALAQAEANVKSAKARLDAVKTGTLEAQRQAAEAQVVAARERLKADQARLDQVLAGAQPEEIEQAEAAVRQAEQQLALASQPVTEQEIRAQRALVEQARLQMEKARNPYTVHDLEAAEAAVAQARAQLEQAQLTMAETEVVAPVDGVVSERLAAEGALVGPSTPLLTLVPPVLELVANVGEAQLGRIKEGQTVTLQVAAYADESFTGTVKSISPTVDPRTRTASIRIEPRNGDGKLRPGMFAKLNIVTASKEGALLVPRTALIGGAGGAGAMVLTIDQENRARRTPVQVGLQNDQFVEILGGLSEGQLVVTSSIADLSDGDVVTPQVQTTTAFASTPAE